MRTKFICFVAAFFTAAAAFSQQALPIQQAGKWGIISPQGQAIIPPTYGFISAFNQKGVALFRQNGKEGLLSASGQVLVPAKYDKISPTEQGDRFICWLGGQCGLMDQAGNNLLPVRYDAIEGIGKSLFKVTNGGAKGLANTQGELLLPAEYEQVLPSGQPHVFKVKQGGKEGFFSVPSGLFAERLFGEVQLQQQLAIGKNGYALTRIPFDESGKVLEVAEYPNETAMQTDLDNEARKAAAKILEEHPEARKPRWVQRGFPYTLENGAGQNLLRGKTFYEVNTDDQTGLSFAKESVKAKEKGQEDKVFCYVLEHETVTPWFAIEAKDLMLTDFRQSEWARAQIDTLWDALVHKSGKVLRQIDGKPITNVGNFADGRAWVQSGGRFGYIDAQAKLVLPFAFEVASDFENGMAIGRKDGKFGCFDTTGKTLIPFRYDGIGHPTNGVCRVKQGPGRAGRWGLVSLSGEQIVPFAYRVIYPFKNGLARVQGGNKWGIIDTKGELKMSLAVQVDYLGDFENGIAQVGIGRRVEQTGVGPVIRYDKVGYLKQDGSWLIEPKYNKIEGFEKCWKEKKGLALLVKEGRFGYVDYNGHVVLPAEYQEMGRFDTVWALNQGVVKIKKAGKYGYLDHNGEALIPAEYDFLAENLEQVLADSTGWAIAVKDGRYGCLNYQGEAVIPFVYDLVADYAHGVAIVRHQGKWGAVNAQNEEVLPLQFDGVRFLPNSDKRLLQVLNQESRAYQVAANGQMAALQTAEQQRQDLPMAANNKFEVKATYPEAGVMVVEKNGLQALADLNGKTLTKFDYKEIGLFKEGVAPIKIDHKDRRKQLWGYLNTQGEEVIAPRYKQAAPFSDGLAAVVERGNWVYINKTGATAIANQFREALPFSGGKTLVDGNKIIDKNGNLLGEFTLEGEFASGFSHDRAIIRSEDGFFHIRPDGKPAYQARYDEVTPYIGEQAFVKKGEVWELTRTIGDEEITLRFTADQKTAYVNEYGKYRSHKMPDGRKMKDGAFKKVDDGKWKMIDKNGFFLSELIFDSVEVSEGHFNVTLSKLTGVADLQGEWIAEVGLERIVPMEGGAYRVEQGGKVGYLSQKGKWIWEIPR